MKNIFLDYPDFIDTDNRVFRKVQNNGGYRVTASVQYHRHNFCLRPEDLVGKSVLDLGCCVGATGAWALHHGAVRYVGVEIQDYFAKVTITNLEKNFPHHNWEVKSQGFAEFFESNTERFDVVVLFGVTYLSIHFDELLKQTASITNERIVVDAVDVQNNTDVIEIKPFSANGYDVLGAFLSRSALDYYFKSYGFHLISDHTDDLRSTLGNEYLNRYCVSLVKSTVDDQSFEVLHDITPNLGENKTYSKFYKTFYKHDSATGKMIPWVFGNQVAKEFVEHARHHIPGYERVIRKTIEIIQQLHDTDVYGLKIIDIGCATGYTLMKLHEVGFTNLHGVDNSAPMLEQASVLGVDKFATLYHSDKLPVQTVPFAVVVCNWTMHFIDDKVNYIKEIYDSLPTGGMLILTDKTYNDMINIKLYHHYKKTMGVSDDEICAKAESVKDVMKINPPEWYLAELRSAGFEMVSIVDADYCFTSFLAVK